MRHKNAAIDASRIEHLLAKKFVAPAYAFLPQLRNGTGYTRQARTADAVAFSLWPSRGIYLHGFEIKVSRGDWLAELKKPEKAEEIARFCRHWSLVAAEGIVDLSEVPAEWGLIIATKSKLTTIRDAPARECEPLTMTIAAAVFRNVHDSIAHLKDHYLHVDDLEERVNLEVEREIARRREGNEAASKELAALREQVEAFEEASGVCVAGSGRMNYAQPQKIGEAVKVVMQRGADDVLLALNQNVSGSIVHLQRMQNEIAAAVRRMRSGEVGG